MTNSQQNSWLADLIYADGRFQRDQALVSDAAGRLARVAPANEVESSLPLTKRALLPGMVNAHSHAFQRVLRGRTEHRTAKQQDTFWTWREMMYAAAARLTPEDIYDASRMAFLEMILGGITAVGEFHYLHNDPTGKPYDEPNLLAKQVVRAARDVGLRIALLRVAYARPGFQMDVNQRQARFIEKDAETYLKNLDALVGDLEGGSSPTAREGSSTSQPDEAPPDGRATAVAWYGVAPHSVRAVGLDYLKEVVGHANRRGLPVHMHVAEQQAEVSACIQEYGRSPLALLQTEGLLSERFTAVHAIHVTPKAVAEFARSGAMVCACPTTERNLGDGVMPADAYFKEGVQVALGTDSQVQIDLLEDARALEYHLRLQRMERAVLGAYSPVSRFGPQDPNEVGFLAARLFECATVSGAESIGFSGGGLSTGNPADFFTVDLDDPAIAGASPQHLLSTIVFAASRVVVRDVFVGGRQVVSEGRHADQEEIVERFNALQHRLWS